MQTSTSQWPLNLTYIHRIVRAYLLIGAIGFASAICIGIDGKSKVIVFAIIVLAASIYTYLIWKIFKRSSKEKFLIDGNKIEIPRLILNNHIIAIKNIARIAYHKNNKYTYMVTLFLTSGRHIFVQRSSFSSTTAFEEFIEELQTAIKRQGRVVEGENIAQSLRDVIRTHFSGLSISVILFIVFFCTSNNLESVDAAIVIKGGLTKDTLNPGEWYRLFSSFFIHNSVLHLGLNVMMLGIILHPVEALTGKAPAINILFSSAFFAAIFSILVSPYDYVVGASGGILGLMGACAIFHYRFKEKFHSASMITKTTLFSLIGFQVIGDFLFPSTDIASHAAGFLSGAISAHFLSKQISPSMQKIGSRSQIITSLMLSTIFISAIMFLLCTV